MSALTVPEVGRRVRGGLWVLVRNWLLFLALVAVWELTTRLARDTFFPPPSRIVATAARLWFTGPPSRLFLTDKVFDDILPSLARTLGGWALAAVVGITVGVALGRSRTGTDYVGPLFAFFRSIPSPALIPVFLVLLGIGPSMQLMTIVFGAIWPVLLNSVDGARSVDRVKVETARAFRIPWHLWIVSVVLPAALPKVFAGLRVSLSISLLLMVVSELVGAANGIGFSLLDAQRMFDFPVMWSWLVLLGVLGYGLNALLLAVEHRVLRWQPGHRR